MVESIPDLHPAIVTLVDSLSCLPYVESILLFGSRARGDNQPRSDIDLAIVCPDASVDEWQTILDQVEQAETLLPIDCVRLDEADGPLHQNILQFNKPLFIRNHAT